MPCLFAVIAGMFPRVGTLIFWLARPTMFSAAFNGSWLWPLLGIIFLPFTTLMYVILWSPGIGLTGWDFLWLVMAVFIDISHWSSTAYNNRNQIPGLSSTPSATSTPGAPSVQSAPSTAGASSVQSAPSTPSDSSAPSAPNTPPTTPAA